MLSSKRDPRRGGDAVAAPVEYEGQKQVAGSDDTAQRRQLALSPATRPEVLYYLVEDESPEVRRAVAANPATPVQADALLAADLDDDVRADLALKLARLLPDMPESERDRVRERTLQVLETLAQDQVPRVRAIVSDEIKRTPNVPKHVVLRLARDAEEAVCAPVLEYSPMLSDADLMEIIAAGAASGALCAIARRDGLSGEVSDAVVATLDVAAVAGLLANPSAQVREDTLDRIIDSATDVQSWHEPLVMRPELSVRAIRRIAGFVASSLVDVLARRHELDPETARELSSRARTRVQEGEGEGDEADAGPGLQVEDLFRSGSLDPELLDDALEAGRRAVVEAALVRASGLSADAVQRIVRSGSGRTVTALAWKAGLSMRMALRLQSRLAGIPPQRMLNARFGTDFPLAEEELAEQLSGFA